MRVALPAIEGVLPRERLPARDDMVSEGGVRSPPKKVSGEKEEGNGGGWDARPGKRVAGDGERDGRAIDSAERGEGDWGGKVQLDEERDTEVSGDGELDGIGRECAGRAEGERSENDIADLVMVGW